MYKIKGQNAKYYKPLADFGFTIANEDGHMSKEYLVRFEFTSIPKVFVVGSDQTIAWYGDVHDKEFMVRVCACRQYKHILNNPFPDRTPCNKV